jgi:tRNA1(Val) A37 N6-methylase TrmN6
MVCLAPLVGCDTQPEQEEADGGLPLIPHKADYECGQGTPEDYEEIYPSNIINVAGQYYVEEIGGVLTRFSTVMFDKYSLGAFSEAYRDAGGLQWANKVLDIGTGTGALGLMAMGYGAKKVVATELDPVAVQNALYNAHNLGVSKSFEVRQVPWTDQGAFSVLAPEEQFDLILADLPQGYFEVQKRAYPEIETELDNAKEVFFSTDSGFCLLLSLMNGLNQHLAPDGKAWLAMKVLPGKNMMLNLARQNNMNVRLLWAATQRRKTQGIRLIGDLAQEPDLSVNMDLYELTRSQ